MTGTSKIVHKAVTEPMRCYDYDTGSVFYVDPSKDPERFLKELPNMYHGTYFWAEPHKEPDVAAFREIPIEFFGKGTVAFRRQGNCR